MFKLRTLLLLRYYRGQCCGRFSSGQYDAQSRRKKAILESQTSSSTIKNSQPGIGGRLQLIKEDQPDIEDMDLAEEDIEDMEKDFLNSREIAQEHEREMRAKSFKVGLKITERKHFKPPVEPTLLSWSEKEQIRNLHSEDRIVWTVEKLAESFPATEDIIAKVLKAAWKPSDVAKVRKHDEKVAENWRKWYAGELTIHNQRLREHLKKFNRRNFLPNSTTDYSSHATRSLPEPKTSEFSSIIQSYQSLKLQSEENENFTRFSEVENYESLEITKTTSKKNKYLDKRIRYGLHTLDSLRMNVAKRMGEDREMTDEEREMDRQLIKKYVEEVNKRQEKVGRRWGGGGGGGGGEEEEDEEETSTNNLKRTVGEGVKERVERSEGRNRRGIRKQEEGEYGIKNLEEMREEEERKYVKSLEENEGDKVDTYESHVRVAIDKNERLNKEVEDRCGSRRLEVNGDKKGENEKINHRSDREGEKTLFSEIYHEGIDNKTGGKVGSHRNFRVENENFDKRNVQELEEIGDSSYDESIIDLKSADFSEIENQNSRVVSADLRVGKSSSNQEDSNWSGRSPVESQTSEGQWLNERSADLETVNVGQIGSNVYESQFNAGSKYPPARFTKAGNIVWRPEKKHAVDGCYEAYRIRIPRDKIKKGCLYKVKDCFYTHEGEFLYRVPGMT